MKMVSHPGGVRGFPRIEEGGRAVSEFSLSRRRFLEMAGVGLAVPIVAGGTTNPPPEKSFRGRKWYSSVYRRAVIDMHISDWDEKFFSEFDPGEYVRMLVKSRAQSVVCYCQSHTGLFNYPTEVGQQHRGWKGRNILQEMIDGCHREGIAVQLYVSLIYDRWCGDQHPEWRIRTWDGKIQGEGDRHAVLCPNSPYRDYVGRFVEEICRKFDFEGIRFDMTFWPSLCYCKHCQQRFEEEVGGDLPLTVDWFDPDWVAFQRCRERWLVEFARLATDSVRRLKPGASVEHQASTFPLDWMFGVTAPLARQNDFLQGDFYGDQMEGSFVRKLLEELTPNRPFGYETSASVSLRNHTALKSEPLLEAKASAAITDHAAFVFIDAIDPIGTVNPRPHERMGKIFERLMPYYDHLGGKRVKDLALFFSLESKFDFAKNGCHVKEADRSNSHLGSSMKAARRMLQAHLPWGVVTKDSLPNLEGIRVLVLSNVNMMDEEETEWIREWVGNGGTIYASGGTSLVDKSGKLHEDFMLADVFGVSLKKADWNPWKHYITPTEAGQRYFLDYNERYPVFCTGYGMRVKAGPDTEVLATTTLPWSSSDPTRFASIHSDPPWTRTSDPELTLHSFGKGRAVYSASLLENIDELPEAFVCLIQELAGFFSWELDAPASVEGTLFEQPDRSRYVLALADFQESLPNIPIRKIRVRLRLSRTVTDIREIKTNHSLDFRQDEGVVTFTVPVLETLAVYGIGFDS